MASPTVFGDASPVQQHRSSEARDTKRQKVTRACDNCKSRKRRCTGELPCYTCHANGAQCTYRSRYTRGRLVAPQPANYRGSSSSNITLTPTHQQQGNADIAFGQTHSEPPGNFLGTPSSSHQASPEVTNTSVGHYAGTISPHVFLRRTLQRLQDDEAGVNSTPALDGSSTSMSIFAHGDRPAPAVDHSASTLPSYQSTSTLLQHYFDLSMPTIRFLHRGTVETWLDAYHDAESRGGSAGQRYPAREAVVLVVIATARLLNVDGGKEILDADETSWHEAEHLYQMAQRRLQSETGRCKLESVQARLASCLYLLQTSRPNQAWYMLGTTVQLLFSLGLHRSDNSKSDAIIRECRKRAFWACSTLDTYLSVIMGVPALINLEEVDQVLPEAIDDGCLAATGVTFDQNRRDSIIQASISHAWIMRIVKRAAREQYLKERKRGAYDLETAARYNAEVDAWQSSLPAVLSGAIHPSSLVATFRRQLTVITLAHAHAQMLINRPSLLVDSSRSTLRDAQVQLSLQAAEKALDTVLTTSFTKHIFQAFWHTQFVSFNAISIIYVWFVQRKHGRLPPLSTPLKESQLFELAQSVQQHLAEATKSNAPSLRYNIVLEELQQEAQRPVAEHRQTPPASIPSQQNPALTSHFGGSMADPNSLADVDRVLQSVEATMPVASLDTYSSDFALDPNLWLTLDSFPFTSLELLD
ncbi:unnamed protein product [Cercospora beticola]|nr:unnamed protein product [Cercospora beticola]